MKMSKWDILRCGHSLFAERAGSHRDGALRIDLRVVHVTRKSRKIHIHYLEYTLHLYGSTASWSNRLVITGRLAALEPALVGGLTLGVLAPVEAVQIYAADKWGLNS